MTPLALATRRSDDHLVTAARAGSGAAESELVRRYRPVLTRYCASIVGEDLADDAVNQALMQALVALRRDQRPAALRPWLFRIARNCAIDVARDRGAHSELDERACGRPGPAARIEQRETMRSIVGELGRLAPHERRALVAREFEGSSYVDIASELGHSVGAVRQMIFRARRRVREGAVALLPLLRLPRAGGTDVLGALGMCATTAVLATAGVVAPPHAVAAHDARPGAAATAATVFAATSPSAAVSTRADDERSPAAVDRSEAAAAPASSPAPAATSVASAAPAEAHAASASTVDGTTGDAAGSTEPTEPATTPAPSSGAGQDNPHAS
ncbi:MAG TPA: sigma-70 family RNA polymerase sigma factor, partial [Solirubrobacteraceae bacterium]|nr:sigma-70 family RNA polymerase sigma factor [Solirubrobacteraceae bacterium]